MKLTHAIRRKCIQIAAFGLTNSHLGNFTKGQIYTGPWKKFCAPGLHCYSCPAAGLSCPIGALQAVHGSMNFNFSFYVVGFLLAVGVLLGRLVCGFLCPFGLIQELLHKIPSPKLHLPAWCRWIKYVILLIFVLVLPVAVTNLLGMGDPWFCKYICPSGTLTGAIPLLSTNESLRPLMGPLFWWKILVLALVILGSVLIYRFFCRVLCPLGAIYGFFNPISFYRLTVDSDKCVHCGSCQASCPMGIDPVKTPNSMECIRCGECKASCPEDAISLKFKLK